VLQHEPHPARKNPHSDGLLSESEPAFLTFAWACGVTLVLRISDQVGAGIGLGLVSLSV
jgi:hypothetical protein